MVAIRLMNVKSPLSVISLTFLLVVTEITYLTRGDQTVRIGSMDVSPDGTTLAVSVKRSWRDEYLPIFNPSNSHRVRFYELDTWEYREIRMPEADSMTFTPEWNLLAAYPVYDYFRVVSYDIEGQELVSRSLGGHNAITTRFFFSSDGNFLASSERLPSYPEHHSRILWIWAVANGKMIARIEQENPITIGRFSPDGQHIVTGDSDGNVSIWDFVSSELRTTLVEHRSNIHGRKITGVAYSHDGELLATSSNSVGVIVWDVNAQGVNYRWGERNGASPFVTFSPDDSLVAVHAFRSIPYKSFEDITNIEVPINLRSTIDGEILATLAGAGHSIAFSADSDTVYTGGPDDTIRVWNVSSGLEIKRLKLKTVENWLIIPGVLGVIWFLFWLITIRRDGLLGALQAPFLAVAITTTLTLFIGLTFLALGSIFFSGFPFG